MRLNLKNVFTSNFTPIGDSERVSNRCGSHSLVSFGFAPENIMAGSSFQIQRRSKDVSAAGGSVGGMLATDCEEARAEEDCRQLR